MSERTSFPVFPNITAPQYVQTLVQLGAFLERENPDFRSLREKLRSWSIWERERGKDVLGFLMVPLEDLDSIPTGRLLTELGNIDELEAQHDLLFSFFNDRNPFLMKTIFTALDAENDGRIQSTNELYKIVTSYIYPGQRMTLPDFRDWISWMEAIEVIRLVGIRWGFGETAKRHLSKIQQIDIEELVEDFNDGMFNKWVYEAPGAKTAPNDDSAQTADAPEPASVDEDFEDLPDMPSEAPIPDEAAIAAAEAALGIEPESDELPAQPEQESQPTETPEKKVESTTKTPATGRPKRAKSASRTHMTEMVLPSHTNAMGTVFGGVMMSWMDICAAICARRHARCPVVTAAVDELHFLRPVQLGDTVLLEASVASVGFSSMEILVKVARERTNPDAIAEPTTEAYFTFVAIGSDGKPCQVPGLSEDEKDLGKARRTARLTRRAEKCQNN